MILFAVDEIHIVVFALLTAIFGVGRLTRVIVYDDFPPAVWMRMQWDKITRDGPWAKLFHCWWCMSFWIALLCVLSFIASVYILWVAWAWWIFWGALALSYVATMVIVRDEPKDDE